MYDNYEFEGTTGTARRVILAVGIVAALVVLTGTAFVFLNGKGSSGHASGASQQPTANGRSSHASGVSALAKRCTTSLDENYASRAPAIIGPRAFHILAPHVCASAVTQGLVHPDGTMRDADSYKVTMQVIHALGLARMQTLIWNELAVSPYKLAAPGKVTRRERCLAMGYSAYDELTPAQRSAYPPRPTFFRAVRYACDLGIRRNMVPPSGAPNRAVTATLLRAGLAYVAGH